MVQQRKDYRLGKFYYIGVGCKHATTTDTQLNNPDLTANEKLYLNALLKVMGGNPTAFLETVAGLLWTVDNSWSSKDIFYNCNNAGADWNRFKGDATARNTSIIKLVGDELNRRGVTVNIQADPKTGTATTPVFDTVNYVTLAAAANAAVSSNSGVTLAFSNMAHAYNFGNMDDDIKTFMSDPANASNIRDAVKVLNYVIPTSNDAIDLIKFKQIYWGGYYLHQFPIPTGLLGIDCGQIGQSLIQLAAEKANLKQNDLDKLFQVYSEADLQQRMQVISDLTTRFNGLYAQQNCTAAQASGGNDVLKYVLYGLGAIFILVIAKKLLSHGKHHIKPA